MNELINFFIEPYQSSTILNIVLEFTAALFGVVSVFYAKKENILVFPTGIISTALYVYLLSQWDLYGDLIINIYYTLMSIYGWYMWSKIIDDDKNHIPISRSNLCPGFMRVRFFASPPSCKNLCKSFFDNSSRENISDKLSPGATTKFRHTSSMRIGKSVAGSKTAETSLRVRPVSSAIFA